MRSFLAQALHKFFVFSFRQVADIKIDRSAQVGHGVRSPEIPTSFLISVRATLLTWGRLILAPHLRVKIASILERACASTFSGDIWPVPTTPREEDGVGEGINVLGFLRGQSGLAESARSTIRAAAAARIEVHGISLRWGVQEVGEDVPPGLADAASHRVNLFHCNGDKLIPLIALLGKELPPARYRIGYWVWETTKMPLAWRKASLLLDEIWTASTFCREVIRDQVSIPVSVVPHNVALKVPEGIGRKELGLPEDGFVFLSMADLCSTPLRKNPQGALEAFTRAFGLRPGKVYMVVKVSNPQLRSTFMNELRAFAARSPSVILIERNMDRPTLNALLKSCDCFVSLHRSEGFGLPIAESMFLGKPVIATGWSGNMDFMNEHNSLPVHHQIVTIQERIEFYDEGFQWAEPDLDHAARLMQIVHRDRELTYRLGKEAQEEIARNFSPRHVGRIMKQRLAIIDAVLRNR